MSDSNKKINLVVSHPKSGATWFRFLMYACEYGSINPTAPIGSYYPEVHNRPDLIEKKLREDKQFFVKSHHVFSNDLKFLDSLNTVIYLIRNPFDAMLSRLSHYVLEGNSWFKDEKHKMKLMQELIDSANKSKIPDRVDGGWNYHVLSWLVKNDQVPVIIVKYEDLLSDTAKEIRALNKTLELGYSETQIKHAESICSFEKMKKVEEYELVNEIPGMFYSPARKKSFLEGGVQFVNKGKSGVGLKDLPCDILKMGVESYKEGLIFGKYLEQFEGNNCIDLNEYDFDAKIVLDKLSSKAKYNI